MKLELMLTHHNNSLDTVIVMCDEMIVIKKLLPLSVRQPTKERIIVQVCNGPPKAFLVQ
ncbi:hypothetical protein HanIR_Chr05g0250401 [Helianthus annuus]|nr:hypothetical protein HanIR_Chr05g0250401 [Helianthus annuus]